MGARNEILVVFSMIVADVLQPSCCGALLSSFKYKIVDLEDSHMCAGGHSQLSHKISIRPEEPAIIRLGHMLIHNPASVEKCELKIEAPPGYGVSMTINSMNLDFRKNQYTGYIDCRDYVQFTREWDSQVAKWLADAFDTFADKSGVICRRDYKVDTHRPELYQVGKTANIFYTTKNRIEFEYRRGERRGRDKEFTIVATAFKTVYGSCPENFIRCGIENISFCISETLRCDSFINCGFPGSGVDEQGCKDDEWRLDGAMSTHTIIWVTLVLTLAVFICYLISCAMRCWAGPAQSPSHGRLRLWFASSRSPAGSGATSSSGAAGAAGGGGAPAERQHLTPLPSYDSVVRDLGSHRSGLESPPAYKDLFPDPPPPPSPPGVERLPLSALKRPEDEHEDEA